jgi:putative inorganic carbon (hco3(-)) transporter
MLIWLLYIYTALYYIRPFEWEGYRSQVPVLLLVGLIAVIAIIFRMMADTSVVTNKPGVYLLGFTAAICLSHIANGYFGGGVQSLKEFLPALTGFFLISSALTTEREVERFISFLILLTAFLAIEGVFQHATGVAHGGMTPLIQNEQLGQIEQTTFERIRLYGPFNDPNDLGLAFSATVPLIAGMVMRKKWIVPVIALPAILTGIYLTNSRGAVLAALVGTTAYFLLKYRSRKGLFIAAFLAAVAFLASPSRVAQMAGDESSQGRVDAWYEGFQMLKSHPFFGVGMGSFTDYHTLTAHNSYMLVLAELGLFGSFFFLAYCFYSIKWVYDNLSWADSVSESKGAWHNVMLSLVGSHVGVLTAMFFLSRAYVLLPYLTGGVLAASTRVTETGSEGVIEWREAFTPRIILTAVIVEVLFMKIIVSVLL